MKIDRHEANDGQRVYRSFLHEARMLLAKLLKKMMEGLQQLQADPQEVEVEIEPPGGNKNQPAPRRSNEISIALDTKERELPPSDSAAAQTAAQLVREYGQPEGRDRVYEAQDYRITLDEQGETTVSDRSGNTLMRVVKGEVVDSKMSPQQLQDFTRVQSQIEANGFAQNSAERLRQYQNLAPSSDVSLAHEVRNIAATISAKRILDGIGKDIHENEHYYIQRQDDGIRLVAKDGRGEILSSQNGVLRGDLAAKDIMRLNQVDQAINGEPALARQFSREANSNIAVSLESEREQGVYDRLMSTGSYSATGAKHTAEQAVSLGTADIDIKELSFDSGEAQILSDPRTIGRESDFSLDDVKSDEVAVEGNESAEASDMEAGSGDVDFEVGD